MLYSPSHSIEINKLRLGFDEARCLAFAVWCLEGGVGERNVVVSMVCEMMAVL